MILRYQVHPNFTKCVLKPSSVIKLIIAIKYNKVKKCVLKLSSVC